MRTPPRHAFRFKVVTNDGKTRILTVWARVVPATKAVQLVLSANHVRRSIALKGVGNTQTCTMAVCAKEQAASFPHDVHGYIDWQYTRAFVVSKISKETGMPIVCVAYRHQDKIAKLNDSKDGQRKLLAELEQHGDRVISLHPVRRQKTRPSSPMGKRDGSRSSRPAAVGAKLRFAVAQLGGVA